MKMSAEEYDARMLAKFEEREESERKARQSGTSSKKPLPPCNGATPQHGKDKDLAKPDKHRRRIGKRKKAAVKPEIAELNKRHFVVSVGGKTRVGTDLDEGGNPISLELSTFPDFRNRYSNRMVSVPKSFDASGDPQNDFIPLGTYWLKHPERRQYDRIVFDPSVQTLATVYNLWRGFSVESRPGDWSLLHKHILDNICGGDECLFEYVLGWMAYAVQRPERQGEVALVLRGAKGTGKGTLANAFGRLFGKNYLAISNSVHLTGHFNAHLRETILLLVDEGFWAGDKQGEGVLKQLITEPKLAIERKGYDVEQVPNRLHVIMASNDSWVVPASGLERRYCVLDVSDAHARDTTYFGAIWKQLKSGGYEAMLHDLLAHDLSGFDVREVPSTAALWDQMIQSLSPLKAWWYDRLSDGQLLRSEPGWERVKTDDLYLDYFEETKEQHPLKREQFASRLRKLLPPQGLRIERPRQEGGRPRFYVFPPLVECREAWDRQHAMKTDWLSDLVGEIEKEAA